MHAEFARPIYAVFTQRMCHYVMSYWSQIWLDGKHWLEKCKMGLLCLFCIHLDVQWSYAPSHKLQNKTSFAYGHAYKHTILYTCTVFQVKWSRFHKCSFRGCVSSQMLEQKKKIHIRQPSLAGLHCLLQADFHKSSCCLTMQLSKR